MVTAPQYQNSKLKFIQLSQVDENQLLAVIVVDGNVIKNKLMNVERMLGNDEILKLNVLLNTFLQGASLQDINLEMIHTIKAQAGEFADIMESIFQGIAEAIHEADEVEIYTSGTTNMLKYPELGNIATYEIGNGLQGTIGIIGPKRMDYKKVVSTLKNLTGELDTIFKKKD